MERSLCKLLIFFSSFSQFRLTPIDAIEWARGSEDWKKICWNGNSGSAVFWTLNFNEIMPRSSTGAVKRRKKKTRKIAFFRESKALKKNFLLAKFPFYGYFSSRRAFKSFRGESNRARWVSWVMGNSCRSISRIIQIQLMCRSHTSQLICRFLTGIFFFSFKTWLYSRYRSRMWKNVPVEIIQITEHRDEVENRRL